MISFLATNKYNLKTLRVVLSGTHSGLYPFSWKPVLTLTAASGAAPLGAPLVEAVHSKMKSVGANTIVLQGWKMAVSIPMFNGLMTRVGYGLTEMSPVSHLLPYDQFLSRAGSVGVLVPNLEARLIRDGVDVKLGEPGELWLRGPTVMKVWACTRKNRHCGGSDVTHG